MGKNQPKQNGDETKLIVITPSKQSNKVNIEIVQIGDSNSH